MKKSKTFLSWWLFTFFTLTSLVFVYQAGFFQDLYQNDQTKISFVIIFFYFIMSIVCGKHCKKLDETYIIDKEEEYRFNSMGTITKWFATAFTTMGMIGTVIGFITAFLPLLNLDTNNAEMVQAMASDLAGGIMTAMYTTLVGMICGLFLAFQNLIVDKTRKKKLEYSSRQREDVSKQRPEDSGNMVRYGAPALSPEKLMQKWGSVFNAKKAKLDTEPKKKKKKKKKKKNGK
jgi:flagellar motor component MotA